MVLRINSVYPKISIKGIIMKKICLLLVIVPALLFGAGEKEFGKLLNDLSVILDNLANKISDAKSGPEMAKALNTFSKEAKPLITQKKNLAKKFPQLFNEENELPDQVIPQAEKLAKSSERYNEAMNTQIELLEDNAVQKALDSSDKVFEELNDLIGGDEEGEIEEDE